jgi:hypothetical protein
VFYGKPVRVRSEVMHSYDWHAFTLSDHPLLAAPEVLVLVPHPLARATENYMLMVVGIARPFNSRDLERDFPWFNRHAYGSLLGVWQSERIPVIIAQSVRTENGLELVQQPLTTPPPMGAPASNAVGHGQGTGSLKPIDSLGTLFFGGNSLDLAGWPVSFKPVSVIQVINPEFITIGTDIYHQLLVRLPVPGAKFRVGDSVAVFGTLEPLPTSLETWGIRRAQLGLGAEQPVYIAAQSVTPVIP